MLASARPEAAHPRAGGENCPNHLSTPPDQGSSPRGRGKHCVKLCICLIVRLIPARAGKTPHLSLGWLPQAAHPRAGGENNGAVSLTLSQYGSSPHARGKRSRSESSPPTKAAHPRMGGENLCYKQVTLVSLGSSPHARGKLNGRVDGNLAPGLIPARAGKTGRKRRWPCLSAAHPRAGGEN